MNKFHPAICNQIICGVEDGDTAEILHEPIKMLGAMPFNTRVRPVKFQVNPKNSVLLKIFSELGLNQ